MLTGLILMCAYWARLVVIFIDVLSQVAQVRDRMFSGEYLYCPVTDLSLLASY
jgi:hypothetical protein